MEWEGRQREALGSQAPALFLLPVVCMHAHTLADTHTALTIPCTDSAHSQVHTGTDAVTVQSRCSCVHCEKLRSLNGEEPLPTPHLVALVNPWPSRKAGQLPSPHPTVHTDWSVKVTTWREYTHQNLLTTYPKHTHS